MGLFSTCVEIGPRAFTPYRSHMFEFFAQDTWRVNQEFLNSVSFNNTGFQNWSGAAFKSFAITERQFIQFHAEFFQLPQSPELGGTDTNATFGMVTGKSSERNIQLSLRYSF